MPLPLRRRLIALVAAQDPEMAARELELILDDDGWPTVDEAGPEGQEAALTIALASPHRPSFMRLCLSLLQGAVRRGEAPAEHAERLAAKVATLP